MPFSSYQFVEENYSLSISSNTKYDFVKILTAVSLELYNGKKKVDQNVVRLGKILLIYFFMFVIFKMDFTDKSNEIYGYHLKVTGISFTFSIKWKLFSNLTLLKTS